MPYYIYPKVCAFQACRFIIYGSTFLVLIVNSDMPTCNSFFLKSVHTHHHCGYLVLLIKILQVQAMVLEGTS
jgi:hypothetical protein